MKTFAMYLTEKKKSKRRRKKGRRSKSFLTYPFWGAGAYGYFPSSPESGAGESSGGGDGGGGE